MKTSRYLLAATLFLWASLSTLQSAVILSLVDGTNIASSTVNVTRGSTFTAGVYVTGLVSSQPLDGFSVELAALPTGVTVITSSSTLSNWAVYPGVSTYNLASGYDTSPVGAYGLTGNVLLLTYTLSVDASTALGSTELDFTSDAGTAFYDASISDIFFTQVGLTLNVKAIPEPQTYLLLAFALGWVLTVRNRHRLCPVQS